MTRFVVAVFMVMQKVYDEHIEGGWGMDEQAVTLFLQVIQYASIRRAAKALFLSEPALNGRIHRLEEDLGVPLLDRTRRGIELTPQGILLTQLAHRYLMACNEIRLALQSAGRKQELNIAASPDLATYLLPSVLSGWVEYTGSLSFAVSIYHPPELLQGLESGRFNVGLLRTPGRFPNLAIERLMEEPLVMISARSHPERLSVHAIAQWEVLCPVRDYRSWQVLQAFWDAQKVWPRTVVHINHPDLIKQTVAANPRFYGVVPQMVLNDNKIQALPLQPIYFQDADLPLISAYVVWRRDSETKLLHRFINWLKASVALTHLSQGPTSPTA